MKRLYYFTMLFSAVIFTSCMDKYTEVFKANTPVYMSYETMRSVKPESPTPLKNPGKIYFKDNYLFVVEKLEGIHVLDISSPAAPKNLNFIKLPGCVDITIRDNILYADSYIDLVALDVSNINAVKEVGRVKEAFPYSVPPTNNNLRVEPIDNTKGVVIGWEVKEQRKEIKYQTTPVYPIYWYYDKMGLMYDSKNFSGGVGTVSPSSAAAPNFGKSGSMARFGLYDNYLYSVDRSAVYVFSLQNPLVPVKQNIQYLGWNIETMFMYDSRMFLGTNQGMIICSLQDPLKPTQISSYSHITSCDPVVVENGYAYVTLRSGQTCRNATMNQLDVLQLSADYKTISFVQSYTMTNPHGLGIDGNTLFLCDGSAGLKVYDCTDKKTIASHAIAAFPGIQAYDVIPVSASKYLFMVGDGGFYLYDYNNLKDIKLLSKIDVVK